MCGLTAAYAQTLRPGDIGVLRTLLYLSDLRGGFGAGEVSVNKKGDYHLIKENFSAQELINTKVFNDRMKDDLSLVIGHSRWPTKGSVDRMNAHPHGNKKVVGVHNGTFRFILEEPVKDTDNDSKTFFDALSEADIKEVVSKTIGAYALLWIDKEAKEFRILRNTERPLFYAKIRPFVTSKEGQFRAVFLSSERRMLHFALDRGNLLSEAEIGEVPINKMICFPQNPPDCLLENSDVVDIPECTKYYYPKYEPWWKDSDDWSGYKSTSSTTHKATRVVYRSGQMYDVLPSGQEVPWSRQRMAAQNSKTWTKGDTKNDVIPFCIEGQKTPLEIQIEKVQRSSRGQNKISDDAVINLPVIVPPISVENDFTDPDTIMKETSKGHFISLRKFDELLQKGCSWCSQIPTPQEVSSVKMKPYFFSVDEFLCNDCMHDDNAITLAGLQDNEKRA